MAEIPTPRSLAAQEIQIGWPRTLFLLVVVIVLVVVASQLLITSYGAALARRADTLAGDIRDLSGTIPAEDLDRLLALDRQIKNLTALLGRHVYFSRAFDEIERLTLPQVRFVAMNVDRNRSLITIRAIAPSLEALASQAASFSRSLSFTSVMVKNTSRASGGGVLFDLELAFDPSLLQFAQSSQ
jgi:hypothetical protein